MEEAFIGIDVAFAKKKRLPVCMCVRHEDGGLEPKQLKQAGIPEPPLGAGNAGSIKLEVVRSFAEETVGYLRALEAYFGVCITRIGIDSPSAPRLQELSRRRSEKALDKAGISCIPTPSREGFDSMIVKVQRHLMHQGKHSHMPHANQLWMLVGFALFERLTLAGWECIEVYPQATMRVLGVGSEYKKKPGAVQNQMEKMCEVGGWLEPRRLKSLEVLKTAVYGAPHDRLDAYASAWVASLPLAERQAFGEPPADAIWVPRV